MILSQGELFEIDALGLEVNRTLDLENKTMKNDGMKSMDEMKSMDVKII